MKNRITCPHCGLTYDHAQARLCPYCGQSPHPSDCPDPLCLLDLDNPAICSECPKKPRKKRSRRPGWGGRRPGAGAPRGNLNRLSHGKQSQLLKGAVKKLVRDPELRALLLMIARVATTGDLPDTTRKLIIRESKKVNRA